MFGNKNIVWLVLASCYLSCLECSGVDDGGRCKICGKMTMMGSTHNCRPRKSFNSRGQSSSPRRDPEKDFITGKSLKDMQKLLPPLEGHKVLGIEIDKPRYQNEVHAYLKVEESFGKTSNWELTEPKYQYLNDSGEKHEKALAYYKNHTLLLPVLPIKGCENQSRNDLPADILSMVQYFEDEQNRAKTKLKIEALNIREQARLYKAMDGLCGRKIFAERGSKDNFDINQFGGEYVKFTPDKSVWGCTEYFYLVTPETKRIYEITLRTRKKDNFDKIKQSFEKKYTTQMDKQEDGSWQMYGKNNKGNERTITLSMDEEEISITLSDLAGKKQADKEGSKYLAHLREIESERKMAAEMAEEKALEESLLSIEKEQQAQRQKELVAMYELKSKLLSASELVGELRELEAIRMMCPIHKWDECYAPVYGGDYFTNSAKSQYFQSKMAAIQAGQKCTCYSEKAKQYSLKISEKMSKINLSAVFTEEVSDKIRAMLYAEDFKITDDERRNLRLVRDSKNSTFLRSYFRWQAERKEFDK